MESLVRELCMTYRIIVTSVQRRRIWHRSIHCPSFRVVFGPDKVLNLCVCRYVTWCEFGLPVLVRPCVSPSQHALQLFICPRVQVHGFDSTDVCTHPAVNAGTSNTDKDTEIPTRPSWMFVLLAVCTTLVAFQLHQAFECLLIGSRPIGSGSCSSRHALKFCARER